MSDLWHSQRCMLAQTSYHHAGRAVNSLATSQEGLSMASWSTISNNPLAAGPRNPVPLGNPAPTSLTSPFSASGYGAQQSPMQIAQPLVSPSRAVAPLFPPIPASLSPRISPQRNVSSSQRYSDLLDVGVGGAAGLRQPSLYR